MGKKILIGITILLISGLLAGWYLFSREAKYFGTSAFCAVPENASVIIRIHHLGNYASRSLKNPIWTAYSAFPSIAGMYQKLGFADSLFKQYSKKNSSFTDKDLVVMYGGEKDQFWNLFLIELSGLSEKRALVAFVDQFFSHKGAAIEKVKSGGASLQCYSWKQGEQPQHYCIAFYHGLFLACNNRQLVEQAIKQLESPTIKGSSVFEKANKTATDNIDLNIYLNHKKLPQFARQLFSEPFLDRLKGSNPLAEWSEIDLSQKNNEFLFNGFSFTGDSLDDYLGIFLHQQPASFNLGGLFPAETSFFLSYAISNGEQFFGDYETLLDRNNELGKYKNSLNEINSLYGIDLQKTVIENLDGAAAMVFTTPDPVMPEENKYLVLRAKSGSNIENALMPLTIPNGNEGKRNRSKNTNLYRIDKETAFKIYKTPVNDFGGRVFGTVFSDVVTNYFTIYDNCLIMAASFESLGRFLRANVLQQTLGNDKQYIDFTSALSSRFNFYLWCSPGKSLPFFKESLDHSLYKNIEGQINDFRKIESVGWQIGIENGIVYNMGKLRYNAEIHENETLVEWKSHLGNRVINQPQFVINPADKAHREIVVQDSEYSFMQISAQGRIVWKIKLSGPIRSKVFQIDYFRDGRLQYFFSTDNALHLIDHEGNYIRNYPLTLRSAATNGVSVVDYDGKKDYRFFIAGRDHKVYLYDKKGKIVTDWIPAKTEHDVTQPVQYFKVERKDYIVFADNNRAYILDRKGKSRVAIRNNISYSNNRFTLEPRLGNRQARLVTTDLKGTVVSIGFDGSVKKLTAGPFSPDHYFIYDDLDGDGKRDYIFLDGDSLVVFDQSANRLFTRKFNHSTGIPPELYTFPDRSRKIGISDSTENRIYLVNPDGSICKGFPLDGNSRFTLGFQGNETSQFNLITGASDGYLDNYQVK